MKRLVLPALALLGLFLAGAWPRPREAQTNPKQKPAAPSAIPPASVDPSEGRSPPSTRTAETAPVQPLAVAPPTDSSQDVAPPEPAMEVPLPGDEPPVGFGAALAATPFLSPQSAAQREFLALASYRQSEPAMAGQAVPPPAPAQGLDGPQLSARDQQMLIFDLLEITQKLRQATEAAAEPAVLPGNADPVKSP